MKDNMEDGTMNKEQQKVIEQLEAVLGFLKNTPIKNEAALVHIKKPLDDLQSSLKYLPTEPSFETFPSEMKRNILSYLCDSNAFTAASVCLEWKKVLENRFRKKTLVLGELESNCMHDNNSISEDKVCSESKEMLKASATHKLDVHLIVSHPLTYVDSKLVTDGLLSAKSFAIYDEGKLSIEQFEDLFERLEKSEEIMECVGLTSLDLTQLNQDRLVHCFLNKIKNLRLDEELWRKMFNVELFIRKLSEESMEFKLSHLSLGYLDIPDELSLELVTALCNVEYVEFVEFYHDVEIMEQLIQNILSRSVKIKKLIILDQIDYSDLIDPEDLKELLTKMTSLQLEGTFTLEQREAARTLPEVEVILLRGDYTSIKKGVADGLYPY